MGTDVKTEPLCKIRSKKTAQTVRFVTFNVNGVNTLFNYHPWNSMNQRFDTFFDSLQGDIISLQELKLTPKNLAAAGFANLNLFHSFISLPKSKKGYSGVGLFVRIPDKNAPQVIQDNLLVIKAEEGLTGCLKSPDFPHSNYRDLDKEQHIGGYPSDLDDNEGQKIDDEGRCVVIELANNTVIFSLYCPANSALLEEGENFRLTFLKVLFTRCSKLKNELGKDVIIMGDINVCLDLIDHAETIKEKRARFLIKDVADGETFERVNRGDCVEFKTSTPARELLNQYIFPTIENGPKFSSQFLHDTTREIQKRRLGLYTVWNTLTGARQINHGSRIDMIFTTSMELMEVSDSDIWPFLQGSDHCPAYTDFNFVHGKTMSDRKAKKLRFEARSYYGFVRHRDISTMFGPSVQSSKRKKLENDPHEVDTKKPKLTYVSRKLPKGSQPSIHDLLGSKKQEDKANESSREVFLKLIEKPKSNVPSIATLSEQAFGKPPDCLHGIACDLKTSYTKNSKGKRFWCCPLKSDDYLRSSRTHDSKPCDFFQWAHTSKSSLQNDRIPKTLENLNS